LLGSAARVAALSAFTGIALLVQESALAFRFGVSDSLAAFQVSFLWISLLWNVLAGGTLLQVLVPTYAWARTHLGADAAAETVAALSRWLLFAMIVIAGALAFIVPAFYATGATGLTPATARLSGVLFALMAPTFVLQALAAIVQARLNVDGRYGFAAFTPVFVPIAATAATLLGGSEYGVLAPALGIVGGQALQSAALLAVAPAPRDLLLRRSARAPQVGALRTFFSEYGLVVGAALSLSFILWVDQAAAGHLGHEAIAQLAYANRPVFLFTAFATVAVANVALAGFAEQAAQRKHAVLKRQLTRGMTWIAALSAIILPIWGLFATELVALLYERGAFSAADTAAVASAHQWAIAQIPFYLVATLAWRMLNALRANGLVLGATAACSLLNWLLVIPLSEAAGIRGILAGTATAFAVWAATLVIGVRRLLQ
jgi:peptidoglycan biosynthesis protein MviN/MurJ (putative lipid II flippase)